MIRVKGEQGRPAAPGIDDVSEPATSRPQDTAADGSSARMFHQAWNDFAGDWQQTWLDTQRRQSQAWLDAVNEQQQARQEAWRPVEEAFNTMLKAQREAWLGQDEWRRYQEAYQGYLRAQQEFCSNQELQDRLTESYRKLVRAQQEALDETRERQEKARRGYLAAVQSAWSRVDPSRLDPETLSALRWSTSMATAVGSGAGSR